MPLQLNCRNLPLSKAGPVTAVFVWAGELLGLMERDQWERESPDEFAPSRRTPAPWWVLQVGLGWSMWGISTGPAAGNLLGSESQSSGGGTSGLTPCIKRRPNLGEPDCHKLSMGLLRGGGWLVEESGRPPWNRSGTEGASRLWNSSIGSIEENRIEVQAEITAPSKVGKKTTERPQTAVALKCAQFAFE